MILPEKLVIEILTVDNMPFRKENILIGIQTFAISKNNITLSPFLTNENGRIEITKTELMEEAKNFISYGLMDHLAIETAKDDIEIYLLTEEEINKQIEYLDTKSPTDIDLEVRQNPVFKMTLKQKEQLIEDLKKIRIKEQKRLDKFRVAFNNRLKTIPTSKIMDKWDGRQNDYHYTMPIRLK